MKFLFFVIALVLSFQAQALTAKEATDLQFMVEEEKLARDTYLYLGTHWNLPVFENIPQSEERHMGAISGLLASFGLSDPTQGQGQGEFKNAQLKQMYLDLTTLGQKDVVSAMKVGGLIEETDIQDLKKALADTQNPDITRVYNNLWCGSRNHLRAFARFHQQLAGTVYVAQILSAEQVQEIVDSPHERCGH